MESNSLNFFSFSFIAWSLPPFALKLLISFISLSYSHFIPYESKSIFTLMSGFVLIMISPSGTQIFLWFFQFWSLFSAIWFAKLFLLTRLFSKFILFNKSSLACLNRFNFHLVFSIVFLLFVTRLWLWDEAFPLEFLLPILLIKNNK